MIGMDRLRVHREKIPKHVHRRFLMCLGPKTLKCFILMKLLVKIGV